MGDRSYSLFGGTRTVSIDREIIQKFEEFLYPFFSFTAEYMVLNEGLDRNASSEEMSKAITKGIEYEVFLAKNSPEAIANAIEKGIIE